MPHLEVGNHISYVLLPKDVPTDPNHEYHGVVTAVAQDGHWVRVRLTDPPYEGLDEWIAVTQIRSIAESKTESKTD